MNTKTSTQEMVGVWQTSFGLGLHDEISCCPILQLNVILNGLHHLYFGGMRMLRSLTRNVRIWAALYGTILA